jgi:hypothetical protein
MSDSSTTYDPQKATVLPCGRSIVVKPLDGHAQKRLSLPTLSIPIPLPPIPALALPALPAIPSLGFPLSLSLPSLSIPIPIPPLPALALPSIPLPSCPFK